MVKNKLVYKKLDSSVENTKNNYASVAVLFFDEVEILFIKRSENMPTHKGHIAFPGGKKEPHESLLGRNRSRRPRTQPATHPKGAAGRHSLRRRREGGCVRTWDTADRSSPHAKWSRPLRRIQRP